MFSFRRKNSKRGKTGPESPKLRSRPSLPELHTQGIPWPENLVNVASIRQTPPPSELSYQGAAKSSIRSSDHVAIPFHKPFRGYSHDSGTIHSFYTSPPSAFDNIKSKLANIPLKTRVSQRRTRQAPTFNLMVVGALGTGKTSLLRLLLDASDVSPTATTDQRAALDRFLRGKPKSTQVIEAACVEICESRFDRVLFSVIDTPGLDFADGHELKLERQVSKVMRYIDAQYADTMNEEFKVVRQNKGDQHIHLCIYMIDPSSIMTAASRKALSSLPIKTRSETTISHHIPETSSDSPSDDEDDEQDELTISPADTRIIQRLATRVNVLPVIARADSLTDARLAAAKATVRRDLASAGLDFGVFGPCEKESTPKKPAGDAQSSSASPYRGHNNGNGNEADTDSEDSDNVGEDVVRQARPVIKLRPSRHPNTRRSRSRSRLDVSETLHDDEPDFEDRESVANVRFSAGIVAQADLGTFLPFALIAPEDACARKHTDRGTQQKRRGSVASVASTAVATTDDGLVESPISPSGRSYSHGVSPDDLRGIYTRCFRWGMIDVLDPNHCDFAALRTSVLSTHLKLLKIRTKEVLYEKYRTEKLFARRATHNIGQDETKKLFEELGL